MWLHRRKDKEEDGSSENISPPNQFKEEKKPSGIRKKILKLGGFGHHSHHQNAPEASNVKLSSSELKQLEKTKQLLFKHNSKQGKKSFRRKNVCQICKIKDIFPF